MRSTFKTVFLAGTLATTFTVLAASLPAFSQQTATTPDATASMNNGVMTGTTPNASASQGAGGTTVVVGDVSGTVGNDNTSITDTGIGTGGDVNDSNLNNNQNNLTNGDNTNQNQNSIQNQTVLSAPAAGGSSALVLPRNPLPLGNALLGRKNFGIQMGVNNNPAISSLGGKGSALGWFLQAGLNVPFGKIPEPYQKRQKDFDTLREFRQDAERKVFGNIAPRRKKDAVPAKKEVTGEIVGLSAYNYSAIPSSKVTPDSMGSALSGLSGSLSPKPKVLALSPAAVFSQPLNTGDKIGTVEVGKDYPYLGHTRSGWVKVLMPNGVEGWTSTEFEYIKSDFTEVDGLAVDPTAQSQQTALAPKVTKKTTKRRRSSRRSR
ncbi:MAG: SH3 domain-containing protein [Vampirovibrio sp.]|nr:SH3 domain-containing protein [Vampirovibrio sp.]